MSLGQHPIEHCSTKLKKMGQLLSHRGPDDHGQWVASDKKAGLAHRRLSIIDLSKDGHQPMIGENGAVLVFNGAIYNHKSLREQLKSKWDFVSHSDTEVILAAYKVYGEACVSHLRGMFSFAIWDGKKLFCARDRVGIKPFYYATINNVLYFASEVKALLPFLPDIATDSEAFSEYITFQAPVGTKTLFKHVNQLQPGHTLSIQHGKISIKQFWDLNSTINYDLNETTAVLKLQEHMNDAIAVHLESDVPVGAYVGGGMDSSLVAILASKHMGKGLPMFHGRFMEYPGYDESYYANQTALHAGSRLHIADLTANDFRNTIQTVIQHLDFPVAGPGAFAQYMISEVAAQHVKVVLGGQGGDEIFGGYARYLITYFEQCIKAVIEGRESSTLLPVSPEVMMKNLSVLKDYKPMIKQVWRNGLFDAFNERYFSIVNRSIDFQDEIEADVLNLGGQLEKFNALFGHDEINRQNSYFDSMTRFDFKYLMPGLLHVEDRVSMAHGLESRVPFLDHKLVDFVSSIPAAHKYKNGQLKALMKVAFEKDLPRAIIERKDKMGFPVPLTEWMKSDLKDFIFDILHTGANRNRDFVDYRKVISNCEKTGRYSRKLWAFLSYELWQQSFHDKKTAYQFESENEFVL